MPRTTTPDPLADPVWITLTSRDGAATVTFDALSRMELPSGPAPARFWYAALPGNGRPRISMHVQVSDEGTPLIEDVSFSRPDDATFVQGKYIRLPNADEIADQALDAATAALVAADPKTVTAVEHSAPAEVPSPHRRVRNKPTREYLQRVAEIYRANLDTGAPVLAVSRELRIGQSTAFRHVRWARERGFLPALNSEGDSNGER